MTAPPSFVLAAVERRIAGASVLRGIDLTIEARGVTVVVGRSGSGKTSMLRLLNRLDAPSAGTVRLAGDDLATVDPCLLRRRVGYVAQRPVMFGGTAADNLRVASASLSSERIDDLLSTVGLAGRGDQEAATLSGGEAQRLCVARTLATDPEVILADEPTASLDGEATERIERLARRLVEHRSVAWIWVSHDPGQTERLADRVIVMGDGRVLADGSFNQLRQIDDPVVRAALGVA